MYIQKLDTSKPGLFVVKVNRPLTETCVEHIRGAILPRINEFAPGSQLIILGRDFDSIGAIDDAVVPDLG